MLALPAPVMLSVNIPFAGFYGSIWDRAEDHEAESYIEHLKESPRARERDFPETPDFDVSLMGDALFYASDHSTYAAQMSRRYASAFESWLADSLGLRDIAFEFEEMTRPRYYNFESDRLFVKFSLTNLQAVFDELMRESPETLYDMIRERHTSRSGFISFYDNDPHAWVAKPLVDWDHNELGTLLRAYGRYRDVESFDELFWDEGLYEEVGGAWHASVDWDKLRELVKEASREDA